MSLFVCFCYFSYQYLDPNIFIVVVFESFYSLFGFVLTELLDLLCNNDVPFLDISTLVPNH